ncbi:MAG TPA: glycosyltransferase, partial [Hymenobacter sp.]
MSASPLVVVFATQYMPSGGIESHLREFCLNLTESGVAIDLVIPNSVMPAEAEDFFRRICRRVYLGRSGRSNRRIYWLVWVALKLRTRRYDALYTNGQGNSIGFFAKLLPRRGRWVHHHHTAGDAADRATWSPGYYQALQATDTVIACSQRNASDIQAALARPVQSIPCFSRAIATGPEKTGQNLRFGYYGRLIPEKGIDLL